MKKALLFISLLPLLLGAVELPWKSSVLWNQDAHPLPLNGKVRRLEKCDDGFMAATTAGVGIYTFKEGKYIRKAFRQANELRNAAKVGKYIVFIDRDGLTIWDTATNKVKRSRHFSAETASENQFIMAPVVKRNEVLIGNGRRLWAVSVNRARPRGLQISARSGKAALAALPDGTAIFFDMKKLYRYDGKFTEIPLPEKFKQSEAFHLGVSADGKYLYFGAPFTVFDLAQKKVVKELNINHVRYGYALDSKRDTLYVASWALLVAVKNASTPEKMEIANVVDSMSEVPMYTHRDATPCASPGSVLYLDKSDELLFAGSPGVTIFGTVPHKYGLADKVLWDKYKRDHKQYTGDTAFHERLRKGKLVMGYTSSKYPVTAEALDNMKRNGINTFVLNIFNIEHHRFFPPSDVRKTVENVARMCAERDMLFFVLMTPYNISKNNTVKEFRPLILPSGKPAVYRKMRKQYTQNLYPCLLDREHIAKAGFKYNMVEIAKVSKRAPIAGVLFEMGDGWTATTYRANMYCMCDYCFGEFFKSRKEAVPQIAPAGRQRYLFKRKISDEYVKFQGGQLALICKDAADAMRKINPKLVAGVMLPESGGDYTKRWVYNAFITGFQHKGQAVPVISEQTYAVPYVPEFTGIVEEKYRAAGLNTVLIPGICNYWLTPKVFAKRVKEYLEYTPGVLYYHVGRWHKPFDAQSFYAPFRTLKSYRKGSHTQGEYMALPDPLK